MTTTHTNADARRQNPPVPYRFPLARRVLLPGALALLLVTAAWPAALQAQAPAIPETGSLELTLERMVQLALNDSYEVRQLDLDIEQTQLRLKAQRARLRSRVDLELSAPQLRSISETRWNSVLQRNEIAHEDSRRWEAELSVRQPVILFGYPTNGYLSLNNRMYRFQQFEDEGEDDLRYYNRYFVRYSQPLFQTNSLKNDLEGAELNLESAELDFYDDVVDIVDQTSNSYFGLFEVAYEERLAETYVANLEEALALAEQAVDTDPERAIDADQIRVELANARETVRQRQSDFRFRASRLKTELDLSQELEVTIDPVIDMHPVQIDEEMATEFAMELTPRLRQLDIRHREAEIRLDETQGRGGLQLSMDLTYGREMQNEIFDEIWDEPSNTWTVDVEAEIPIWDWGERDARIQASEIELQQSDLRMEQARSDIVSDVRNEVRNVEEFQDRAVSMQENLDLAVGISRTSLARYQDGTITAQDLLQSLRRESDTAANFLSAYLGWQRAMLRLKEMTYYDFEYQVPVLERFGITEIEQQLNPDGA